MNQLWSAAPWVVIIVGLVLLARLFGGWNRYEPDWMNSVSFNNATPEMVKDLRKQAAAEKKAAEARTQWMQIVITLAILSAALFIILSRDAYSDSSQKWAFGAVGTIIGFWLKK